MSLRNSWILATFAVVGCASQDGSAAPSDEATDDEVVGVGDLALLERTFALEKDVKVDGQWTRDVTRGRCYGAYATPGSNGSERASHSYPVGRPGSRKEEKRS